MFPKVVRAFFTQSFKRIRHSWCMWCLAYYEVKIGDCEEALSFYFFRDLDKRGEWIEKKVYREDLFFRFTRPIVRGRE